MKPRQTPRSRADTRTRARRRTRRSGAPGDPTWYKDATLEYLVARAPELDEELQSAASALIARREETLRGLTTLLRRPITAPRMRCHGDFHLGQVLDTGDDFTVLDFEGEAGRPLYERRLRHSPLLDVATMVCSFHHAMHVGLQDTAGPADESSLPSGSADRGWHHAGR